LEEVEIIYRARQGDQVAWITLVSEHQQPVFRLAYLILGDPDYAEDITQETFVRAFRGLDSFDERRSLKPWLLRIAANLSRNQRRSAGRYWAALTRFGRRDMDKQQDSLEEASRQVEKSRALWEAIRRLRQPDQEILYLRYFLDLSIEATAEALGIAPGTVKSRLHRSMKRLEAIISRDFPTLKEEST
jgi:RNA polymerase sigma-70 factor (ECF subfamily)